MGHIVNDIRSGILVGLAATAGALGAAAVMSATTAPTARADVYDSTIDAINYAVSSGQTAYDLASTDFAGGDVAGGLTALFDGVDDNSLWVPQDAYVGGVDALTNNPVYSGYSENFLLTEPTDFAQAETLAQDAFTYGESLITKASDLFDAGNYGVSAFLDSEGSDYAFVLPLEYLLIGSVSSF